MPKDVSELCVEDVYKDLVSDPAKVGKDEPIGKAIDAIIANPMSQKVYVVDDGDKLIGTIGMDSLLRQVGHRIGARKSGIVPFFNFLRDIFKEKAHEFMKKPVPVHKDTTLVEAIKLMSENNLNNLPVVDENGILIGELNGLEILMSARKLFNSRK